MSDLRGTLRLGSALVLFSFVLCHLANHSLALVSLRLANQGAKILIEPWESMAGSILLLAALLTHAGNALYSVYARRSLRLKRWEGWQLALGLSLPFLLLSHVAATRLIVDGLDVTPDYYSVLAVLWVVAPGQGILQVGALLALWSHACIGLNFWLRVKQWYPPWRPYLGALALLWPTLALAGFVAAGNDMLRRADKGDEIAFILDDANYTPETFGAITEFTNWGWGVWAVLVVLPFAARYVRALMERMSNPPRLIHASGRMMALMKGATVLETLRAHQIPHAAVCGGRGRCTTCRVRVVQGNEHLPPPAAAEARALERIGAPQAMRLACQIRPSRDLAIVPLLPHDASPAEGRLAGGLEGAERLVAVMFVDLRGSTGLGEAKLPYDVLFILNQFFTEMTNALHVTRGHYSQFTGDGLMALYGLDAAGTSRIEPGQAVRDAVRGAAEMMVRLDQLNHHLEGELALPLKMGIGIHFGEAIVGIMGPPKSQILSAIGDTVNIAARLESLTKDYDCPLILSAAAAEVAGLDASAWVRHDVAVKGRTGSVSFFALPDAPQV